MKKFFLGINMISDPVDIPYNVYITQHIIIIGDMYTIFFGFVGTCKLPRGALKLDALCRNYNKPTSSHMDET